MDTDSFAEIQTPIIFVWTCAKEYNIFLMTREKKFHDDTP